MPQRRQRDKQPASPPSVALLGHSLPASRFALRFFFVAAGLVGAAGLMAFALSQIFPAPTPNGTFLIPAAFIFSTSFLILCSTELARALSAVRRERQEGFRRSLLWAVAFGTAFVGMQVFGMSRIIQNLRIDQNAGEAQLGATALVMSAAALHALHVTVALLVLIYVTLRALDDRYDHEYSFGVTVCSWFWHILSVLWIFILGAYFIVYGFLLMRVPPA